MEGLQIADSSTGENGVLSVTAACDLGASRGESRRAEAVEDRILYRLQQLLYPTAPIIAALGRWLPQTEIMIRSVSLVSQTQVGQSWQWRPVAEVPLAGG